MRTVLFVGCSKDWPGYLESEEYNKWLGKMQNGDTVEVDGDDNDDDTAFNLKNKPVSASVFG